jgi:diaminopimelate epimerase
MIPFYKYQGTGNDFIMIDDRISRVEFNSNQVKKLCNRNFGIGADGLILIRELSGFDFEMLYYNSDGLPGSMCGNGGRCAVAFAQFLGIIRKDAHFNAFDGPHRAEITSLDPFIVKLQMSDVNDVEDGKDFVFLNTGSPHYVKFVDSVSDLDVIAEGSSVRYNSRFKKDGTNVNFVKHEDGILNVRTYERGVEGETLSCGTGVTASVLAADFAGFKIASGCKVLTPGGTLLVHFKKNNGAYFDIWLEGPAGMVFSGRINKDTL